MSRHRVYQRDALPFHIGKFNGLVQGSASTRTPASISRPADDAWKVSPRLTLNLGRWDPYFPFTDSLGKTPAGVPANPRAI
jgi:hypothetical protein